MRPQLPLSLDPDSEPEPDAAVVRGAPRDYVDTHPTTALLVVEVADTPLDLDRGKKAGLYAKAGIPEYWIVNLVEPVLEVHRDPAPVPGGPSEAAYRLVRRHAPSEAVTLSTPGAGPVPVADLLP